jgi:hypothetical protein
LPGICAVSACRRPSSFSGVAISISKVFAIV